VVAALDPTLVAAARQVYPLSSTALVAALATVWLVSWFGFELAWEWRAGRLAGDG
jgi:hypothetical protein